MSDSNRQLHIGAAEQSPPHWGGALRRASVLGRPRLATGKPAWHVAVEPPIPDLRGRPEREWILMERYVGERLEELERGWITVNVCRPVRGEISRQQFEDGDLAIVYVAEAAHDPAALPKPVDQVQQWATTLRRIERFIARHGHSHVPDGYWDETGRLDVIVGNIRHHHAGLAGVSPGPFPGLDYASDLDALRGWEWQGTEGERT